MRKKDKKLIEKHQSYINWKQKYKQKQKPKQDIIKAIRFLLRRDYPTTVKEIMEKAFRSDDEKLYWRLQRDLKKQPEVHYLKVGHDNIFWVNKPRGNAKRIAKDKAIYYRTQTIYHYSDEIRRLVKECDEIRKM